MNSYFASVEQQANPFLRGKPVAICSRVSQNACIIACSIEAKKLGIKTGFSLSEARKLAPEIVALEVDPPKIRNTTEKIFAIFADYTSAIEAYSIDEAFLDLTGHVADFSAAEQTAREIKKRIREEVGDWLRCSIGIASTRWLAKFAGELQKPDGLTVLHREDLPHVFAGRPVDEAWGIAKGWKTRLEGIGITTMADLLTHDPLELKRIFGIGGYAIWANVAGVDLEQVKTGDGNPPKSIGHSYVFHQRTGKEKEVIAIMMKLCERVGRRLRKQELEAGRITVNWRYADDYLGASGRSPEKIFDSSEIFNAAWRLFFRAWNRSTVIFLAVTVSDLVPRSGQISIFSDKNTRRKIAAAVDAVNDRYGEFTVMRGRMWGTEKWAPERVGFRQTVDIRKELGMRN